MIQYSNIKAYNQIWSPMGRYPMVDNSIFETYQEALAFATTNAVAVVGSVITVTNDTDSNKNGVYQLIYTGETPLSASSQPTGLKKIGSDIDLSNYVTKDQISSVYTYKGSKDTFAELPVVNTVGDVWNVNEAHDNHPAGTNWVWSGSAWDALAGSVDLSGYATKSEVSELNTSLTGSIASLTGELNTAKENIAKKVDAVEGSSLITSEKLALIDTNASDISSLKTADGLIEARLQVVESAIGDGGDFDLSQLTKLVTEQGTKITELNSDNATNKTNITNLQTEVLDHGTRIVAIETLNTEQSTQLSTLTTRVETVEAYGTAITNLTTTVNGHTQEISDIKSSINGLAIKSVSTSEKVLAADTNGILTTTLGLSSYKNDEGKTYIKLTGIEGVTVSEFDASEFVKDGMIDSVSYNSSTKDMTITWNTAAGKDATVINMTDLVDTYTAGSGLQVTSNEFSVKLNTSSNNKLTVSENGLLVDISSDIAALESTIDNKIEAAFTWVTVE